MVWYRNPGNDTEITEKEMKLILRGLTALQLIARKQVEFGNTPGQKNRTLFHQRMFNHYAQELQATTDLIEKVEQL